MKPHPHSWLGIGFLTGLFFTCLVLGSFWVAAGDHAMAYLAVLAAVLAGTLGAAFVSYPAGEIATALKVAVNSYRTPPPTKQEIVDMLLNLSQKSRADGLLALEGEEERVGILFLRRALSLLVDGFTTDELRNALNDETHFFQQRRTQHERVFRNLAKLALASGIAAGGGVMAGMLALGGAIAGALPAALGSMFLGIVLSKFLLDPVAENIYAKTHEELLALKLVTEGVTLISQGYNTLRLQTHLESFVAPKVRDIHHKGFKEIRDQYEQFEQTPREPGGKP